MYQTLRRLLGMTMGLKDWIDLAGAVGSVIVAVGTGALAWATFSLARFTKATVADAEKAMQQADQHHRENLRPFCVVEFRESSAQKPFGADFNIRTATPGPQYFAGDDKPYISIKGRLYNRGLGPARDVAAYLNWGSSVEGLAYWLTHPIVVCGLIAANESIEINLSIEAHHVATKVADGKRVSTQALEWVANDAYEVVLRYRDIFDTPFRTIHARGFLQNLAVDVAVAGGDKKLEAQQSIRANRPAPVFLTGEQPWATLADKPQPPPGWLGSVDTELSVEAPFRHDV
ncbi:MULTISPECIES: hypothetical protein [unclassified Acidocella]|uniref:hypothetical protein n=1 Tax=unclassified Acidocella TaxID=2648610 RepID=UPI00028DFF51|nr:MULTISPECIES: hypothetical protein [unclassified Acidocella]EKM99410.1 hypothetical protein MXAZACID_10483 [Acidocella sp. MX-AZ02]WBO58075.1 hypothetical protein GT370_12470 [Acidocella sp. MX-AZ03]